jgi:hypothetical protein
MALVTWTLIPLVDLPTPEGVAYPDDWDDETLLDRWTRDRAAALVVPDDAVVGRGHVRADRLPAEAWSRLLANRGADPAEADAVGFDGGLGLFEDERVVIAPMCCSSTADSLGEWAQLAADPPTGWEMFWIGHPWVFTRCRHGLVTITEPTEQDPTVGVAVAAEMARATLSQAVAEATVRSERSVAPLAAALAGRPDAEEVARRALGLPG